MKRTYKKIFAIDLDGTIWKENSHIEVLKYYYGKKFDNYLVKLLSVIFPKAYLFTIRILFNRIVNIEMDKIKLNYIEKTLELIEYFRKLEYYIVIVTNAPEFIARYAASRLNIDYIVSEIGCKSQAIKEAYDFDELLFCTDNKSDEDVIKICNICYVYSNRHNLSVYKKYENIIYLK